MADETVVFFEGNNLSFGEAFLDPDQAILDGFVDEPLALLAEPGFVSDKRHHSCAHVCAAGGFKAQTAHFIELENTSVGAVICLNWMDSDDIAFG